MSEHNNKHHRPSSSEHSQIKDQLAEELKKIVNDIPTKLSWEPCTKEQRDKALRIFGDAFDTLVDDPELDDMTCEQAAECLAYLLHLRIAHITAHHKNPTYLREITRLLMKNSMLTVVNEVFKENDIEAVIVEKGGSKNG